MESPRPAPPLPRPSQPAEAARALAEAAHAAAGAWARPLAPARHARAVSQLRSAARDAGIAARGLAAWQPPGSQPGEFGQHVTEAAGWLLTASSRLDEAAPARSSSLAPADPDEPGAALCHAARRTAAAWREPSGTADERDHAARQLITAAGMLAVGALCLATYAPDHQAADLQNARACLAEAAADLGAALRDTDESTGHRRQETRG